LPLTTISTLNGVQYLPIETFGAGVLVSQLGQIEVVSASI